MSLVVAVEYNMGVLNVIFTLLVIRLGFFVIETIFWLILKYVILGGIPTQPPQLPTAESSPPEMVTPNIIICPPHKWMEKTVEQNGEKYFRLFCTQCQKFFGDE